MPNTISFDRAADFYDDTRGFPPEVEDDMGAFLAQTAGLTTQSHIMELAIGTGRIALPLARAINGAVHGVDISTAMMDRLVAKRNGEQVFPAQGDVGKLPYPAGVFDALFAVHIFHLLPDFPPVEAEMRRVLKPDGVVVQCWNINNSTLSEVRRRFNSIIRYGKGREDAWQKSNNALKDSGWKEHASAVFTFTSQGTPQSLVDGFAQRHWSGTWVIPDDELEEHVAAMREELIARFGDLSRPVSFDNEFHAVVYQRPQ